MDPISTSPSIDCCEMTGAYTRCLGMSAGRSRAMMASSSLLLLAPDMLNTASPAGTGDAGVGEEAGGTGVGLLLLAQVRGQWGQGVACC